MKAECAVGCTREKNDVGKVQDAAKDVQRERHHLYELLSKIQILAQRCGNWDICHEALRVTLQGTVQEWSSIFSIDAVILNF